MFENHSGATYHLTCRVYSIRRLNIETNVGIRRKKYELVLSSLQECWKLLAYTTEVENEKSILVYTQQKQEKIYYLRKTNAEAFIKGLSLYFYGSGLGLFLPKSIRPLLFEYRHTVYGLLLKYKNEGEDNVKLENDEMVKRFLAIHAELVLQIRAEIDSVNPKLPSMNEGS